MVQISKKYIALVGLLSLIFVLAACSAPGLTSSSTSPAQTLANSASVMSKLQSVHFNLQTTLATQTSNGVTFNVAGQGDAASPDSVSVNLTAAQSPLLSLISSGQKVYVQLKGGSWYSVDKSKVKDAEQNFFSQSLSSRLGQLMAALQNAKLTDHGQESVNGEKLDHITATLDQQTLSTLSSDLNSLAPSQAQSGLNQLKQAILDVWIDTSTSYVHQAKIDLVTQIDAGAVQHFTGQQVNSATGALPVELKAQVNFSKFNQPVSIQPPASSIPLGQ